VGFLASVNLQSFKLVIFARHFLPAFRVIKYRICNTR
jgi:hypothetical protein